MEWLRAAGAWLWSVLGDVQNWVDFLLALVATLIAVNQRREQKYDMRVENLRKMVKSIRTERYEYARDSLRYYARRFQDDPEAVADQVLFRRGWVQAPDDNDFLPLNEVRLNLPDGTGDLWDSSRNPTPRFLPTPKEGYAENVKFHCDVNLMNLPLYGLGGVHISWEGGKKQVTLDIIKGRYYDFYDTCEVLSAELAYRRRIQMKRTPLQGRLPLRDQLMDVFDFTNRFAGIGIIVLTILQNVLDEEAGEKRGFFLLHKRSAENVAEGGNSYHAVPAGSYQPATVEFPEVVDLLDRNLNTTVVREFGEELLGKEEFFDLFSSELVAGYGKVPTATFLGVGLDPLNTKTEIMGCMVLDVEKTPLFGGKTTRRAIEERLTGTYEGAVSLKELSMPMLKQYRDNPMSIPAFRQILTVVAQHAAAFGVSP